MGVLNPSALIVRGNARSLDFLPDGCVDEIICSPPYYRQRLYLDEGSALEGQIGQEPHPQEYLESLWACTREWWRVLSPRGVCWVNLADKRAGSMAPGTTSGLGGRPQGERTGFNHTEGSAKSYGGAQFGRDKSTQLLPHRYAIGCLDGLADPEGKGWIVRQDQVIGKKNGLPESVRDRTRDSHEYAFMLAKQGDYYHSVDEIREGHAPSSLSRAQRQRVTPDRAHIGVSNPNTSDPSQSCNPKGAMPGSYWLFDEEEDALEVWEVASEGLRIPPAVKQRLLLDDHFAAMIGGTEVVRRLVLGWSPPAVCLECGYGRWPVTHVEQEQYRRSSSRDGWKARHVEGRKADGRQDVRTVSATIVGYACLCTPSTRHPGTGERDHTQARNGGKTGWHADDHRPAPKVSAWTEYHLEGWTPPPSRRAVVLDPFAGAGTVPGVASALGRLGIGVELSRSYGRLARWRCDSPGQWARVLGRKAPEPVNDLQGTLL